MSDHTQQGIWSLQQYFEKVTNQMDDHSSQQYNSRHWRRVTRLHSSLYSVINNNEKKMTEHTKNAREKEHRKVTRA